MHYYTISVKIDGCNGSCNIFNYSSNEICVSNKSDDINLHVSKMVLKIHICNIFNMTENVNLMVENVI